MTDSKSQDPSTDTGLAEGPKQLIEHRKLDLAERELAIKERDWEFRLKQERTRSAFATPFGVATIGGILAILSGVFGTLVQGCNSTRLERQKEQTQLILRALDTKGDADQAMKNLRFMLDAGLIDRNVNLNTLIEEDRVPSISVPSISAPSLDPRSNEALIASSLEIGKLQASNDFARVLPDTFFKTAFAKGREIPPRPGGVGGGQLSLADSQRVQVVIVHLAKAMIDVVASSDESQPDGWLAAEWMTEEDKLFERLYDNAVLTPNQIWVWRQALAEWRAEVKRVAPGRFRDALVEAAHMFARQ